MYTDTTETVFTKVMVYINELSTVVMHNNSFLFFLLGEFVNLLAKVTLCSGFAGLVFLDYKNLLAVLCEKIA